MKQIFIVCVLVGFVFSTPFLIRDSYGQPGGNSISSAPSHYGPLQRPPKARAASILLKDLQTGTDLYEYRASRRLPPASLTKILSALVILDSGNLDREVTITREAAKAPRTRLRIRHGDVFILRDLLQAMLITSANDACRAATQFVGGSEAQFVSMMNTRAALMGLQDSHFMNACGFDKTGHYSTAQDLARLTELALENPTFREIVSTEHATIVSLKKKRRYELRSTNRLLSTIEGVEGVKTGFTSQAGRCLIAKVRQEGKEILLVLMDAKRRWQTATSFIHYGLNLLNSREFLIPATLSSEPSTVISLPTS